MWKPTITESPLSPGTSQHNVLSQVYKINFRAFAPVVSAHSYCARNSIHVIHQAHAKNYKPALGLVPGALTLLAVNLRSGVLFYFATGRNAWYNYLTIRLPPPNWNICQRECGRCHLPISMNLAQLPKAASWAGILHKARTAWIYMQCCTVRPTKIWRFIL